MAVGEQNTALFQNAVRSENESASAISVERIAPSASNNTVNNTSTRTGSRISAGHAVAGVLTEPSSEIEPIVLAPFSSHLDSKVTSAPNSSSASGLDTAAASAAPHLVTSRSFSAWSGVTSAAIMLALNVGIAYLIVRGVSDFEPIQEELTRLAVGMLAIFSGFTLAVMALALAPSVLQGVRGRRLRSECLELLACFAGMGQCIAVAVSQSSVSASDLIGVAPVSGFGTCLSIAALCLIVALRHLFEERALARLRIQVGSALNGGMINGGPTSLATTAVSPITSTHGEALTHQGLTVGSLIAARVGSVLPCDAQIVQGLCEVRERQVHGSLELCVKRPGDLITAGSVVVRIAPVNVVALSSYEGSSNDGATKENPVSHDRGITCRVVAMLAESRLSAFDDQLRERLMAVRDQFEAEPRMGESVYVLTILVATLAVSSVWGSFGTPPVTLAGIVMGILLIAPPALSLRLAPIMKSLGLSAAYRRGAIINGDAVLERVAQAKRFVIDLQSSNPPGTMRVTNVELIDQRFSNNALVSAIVAVAQAVTEQQRSDFESIKNASSAVGVDDEIEALLALRSGIKDFELQRVHEVAHYPGRGIIATLEGAEFTIGDEEFLILRGVQLQPSDLPEAPLANKLHCWYIAVGSEVVGRLYLAERFTHDGRECIAALRERGMAVSLVSEEPQPVIDPLGGGIGLELALIQGALTLSQLRDRVGAGDDSARGSMVVLSNRIDTIFAKGNALESAPTSNSQSVTLQCFNRLKWDFKDANIVLLGRSLELIIKLTDLARTFHSVYMQNRIAVSALCLVLFVGAASGTLPPWGVASAMLLITMATALNAHRIR